MDVLTRLVIYCASPLSNSLFRSGGTPLKLITATLWSTAASEGRKTENQ